MPKTFINLQNIYFLEKMAKKITSIKIALSFLLIAVLFLLVACSKDSTQKEQPCNLASDCPQGICPDEYEYNKFSCSDNKCVENVFIADPCLNHYLEGDECNSDSDCATGGCSGQVCGKRGVIEGIITTCEFKEEYACLKETKCACMDNQCNWEQSKEYLDCMAKFR